MLYAYKTKYNWQNEAIIINNISKSKGGLGSLQTFIQNW